MASLSKEAQRKYRIIAAIANNNSPSIQDIANRTEIPVSTIKRMLGQIRADFDMNIRFIADTDNMRGRTGFYHITHWGVLDRNEFLVRHGEGSE